MPALKFNCPHCAQPLEVPEEAAGLSVPCPNCQKELPVPAPAVAPSNVCSFCMTAVASSDEKTTCPECRADYHAECWTENGGCAVYGCAQVPVVEHRQAIEIPVSYWGRENKPCPACGKEILAAAVRCRHCGATFESARPQEAAEFQQRAALDQRLPATRKTVVWLFVLCVIPCLAPFGAIWGAVWYPSHREDVNALPSLYPALCKIGLGVAVLQVAAIVLMALLYAAFRGH